MGYYVNAAEVLEVRQVALTGVSVEMVDAIIRGVEARVNTVLKAQGYPDVPAKGATDKDSIRQYVLQEAAVLCWTSVRGGGEHVDAWVEIWHDAYMAWIDALENGRIILMDQSPTTPGAPDRRVRMGRLRVLP